MEVLQEEVTNVTDAKSQLQSDLDAMQALLDTRQKRIDQLTREMEDIRPQGEGISSEIQVRPIPLICLFCPHRACRHILTTQKFIFGVVCDVVYIGSV